MHSLRRFTREHRVIVPVLVVVALSVVALGGVLSAQAGSRHHHAVRMVYRQKSKPLAGNGVQFVTAFCPAGSRITGVGASTPGVAYVNESKIDPGTNSGTVFYINTSSSPSTIAVQIACVKKNTSTTSAKVSAADQRSALQAARDKRSQLRAELSH
jgi:hypothetical protein